MMRCYGAGGRCQEEPTYNIEAHSREWMIPIATMCEVHAQTLAEQWRAIAELHNVPEAERRVDLETEES
jgi:hypothetical protein